MRRSVLIFLVIILLLNGCSANSNTPSADAQTGGSDAGEAAPAPYVHDESVYQPEYVPGEVFSDHGDPSAAAPGADETMPDEPDEAALEPEEPEPAEPEETGPEIIEITISAAGDCALGGDLRNGPNGFMRELQKQEDDYTYFLKNVAHIFEADDLTIVNMEGTFAEHGENAGRTFILRAPPELVEVFTSSGVDVVTIANNHSMDYLRRGYDETIAVLEEAGIGYFGNEYTPIVEVKGIKIGLFGYTYWESTKAAKSKIAEVIQKLRDDGADIVIAYYHWGLERVYYPSAYQKDIARHTIDAGADLVLASHPHVLQGIEEHNGKNIVYSLGNFCFGSNVNPDDKDTMIFQQTFVFTDGELTETSVNIIPCSISSVKSRNNYQPVILEGDEAERVLRKIEELSEAIS